MENQNIHSGNGNAPRFFERISKTLKIVTIGILVLLSLIPMAMIRELIRDRHYMESGAIREVSEKWSGAQTIIGPYLSFDYTTLQTTVSDGKEVVVENKKTLILLPEELNIDAELATEMLTRGIYDVNVYQSTLSLKGSFSFAELSKQGFDKKNINLDQTSICFNVSDMRGISEQVHIKLGDAVYDFDPGLSGKGLTASGVSKIVNLAQLKENSLPFEMTIKLKGSQSMYFAPLGKTTQITMQANWGTPSFDGKFLPEDRKVTNDSFTAQWRVLNLNRSYAQAFLINDALREIDDSTFGVNLKVPVDQYQQSTRAAKYGILIILLTFMVVFFVEIFDKRRIHPLQYLLIGLALCLFYSLLVSLSEQINFGPAYIVAATLTIGLVGLYMRGIMKSWKPAGIMVGLLTILYTYIYVLLQLETLALLAGSLGLFVMLACIMYFSKKVDWFSK
ncbi:cell envelope integrity protein CreD [Bacteroides sp. OttesenSCG-928-D19]|nr:cell envelope integrity protein CreD [Bacteroides sp. OttesenSCG-928-D19]